MLPPRGSTSVSLHDTDYKKSMQENLDYKVSTQLESAHGRKSVRSSQVFDPHSPAISEANTAKSRKKLLTLEEKRPPQDFKSSKRRIKSKVPGVRPSHESQKTVEESSSHLPQTAKNSVKGSITSEQTNRLSLQSRDTK